MQHGRKRRRHVGETYTSHPLALLQKTIGNRAVGQLIQAKLSVSQPGDKLEKEADQTAARVMPMSEPTEKKEELRRKPLEENEEEKLQRVTMPPEKEEVQRTAAPADEEKKVQKKGGSGHRPTITPQVQSRVNNLRGSGKPLSEPVRASFESRFGHDFSGVHVHTDTQAAETARAVNAKAFTVGQDIVFAQGQYAPHSVEGKKLIAHELTHVVQQSGRQRSSMLQRYAVPGELECSKLVEWLDQNSPYTPGWARTNVGYKFVPEEYVSIQFNTTANGVEAKATGKPATQVVKSAPIDMPEWNPTARPNREAEMKAWRKMRRSLQTHEDEHVRIGELWRRIIQSRARQLNFSVVGSDSQDAKDKVTDELQSRVGGWDAEAQAAQNDFDTRTDHGRKAAAGFPAVVLTCP
jgi:hypothetical protein